MAFSSDKNLVAIGENEAYEGFHNSVFVLDLDTGQEVFRQTLRDRKEIAALAISAGGKKLVAAITNHQGSPAGTEVVCWDLEEFSSSKGLFATLRTLRRIFVRGRLAPSVWKKWLNKVNISELHWVSGDELLVASIIGDFSGIYLIDARSGQIISKRMEDGIGAAVTVAPDGLTVAAAIGSGGIEIFQLPDLAHVKTVVKGNEIQRFCSLQFSPDGRAVLAGTAFYVEGKGTRGEVHVFACSPGE